jgi:transposase
VRVAPVITLTSDERRQLTSWSHGRSTPHRLVDRAKIVLRAAEGKTNDEIVDDLRIHPRTVGLWRRRFALLRLTGIEKDAPRAGRTPRISAKLVRTIVEKTLTRKPTGETHWSTRSMAREVGVHSTTVHRIWRLRGIKPHLTQSYKLSRDPRFEEKLIDVVGLYMNPPEKSVVFSVDEKPQTQALDKDWPEGRPHDYRRNGTVDLFVALNILDGKVVTQFHERHRHQEFLIFLGTLDRQVPPELSVHVVLDNLQTHKTPEVQRWLRAHPRYQFHFTPTSASWVNMVESWLGQLQKKALNRGSFKSVGDLKKAIEAFVDGYAQRAGPFVWTKDAQEILRKVRKLKDRVAPEGNPIMAHLSAAGH